MPTEQTTHAARLAGIMAALSPDGDEAVVLSPGSDMRWLTGVISKPSDRARFLVIGPKGARMVVPDFEQATFARQTELPLNGWSDADGPSAALMDALDRVGASRPARLWVDGTMRAVLLAWLVDATQVREWRIAEPLVGTGRMRKDASEVSLLRASAAMTDTVMQNAVAALTPGMTERELADLIVADYARLGGSALFSIVCFGENSAHPHHKASARAFRQGDPVLIDIGGALDGYGSDLTRMLRPDSPPADFDMVCSTVERAVLAALEAARPGVVASVVDAAARTVIDDAGYGPYFTHRTGHGIGLDGHEAPYLNERSDTVLKAGMAFSIEPGIYLPGRFGVRLEEIVHLREDGPEILSSLSRDPFQIPET